MGATRYHWWKHCLLIGGILGILLFRLEDLWTRGQFVAEDGRIFFAGAYNYSFWESILLPYAGYFHVLPRLLAEFLSRFPLAWQPRAFGLTGILVTALLFSVFYLPHFRNLVPQDSARLMACLLFPLLPNSENLGPLFGLHWYLSFAMALTVVMEFPKNRLGRGVLIAGSLLAIWSAPATLVLFPFFLWRAVRARQPAEAVWCRINLVNFCLLGVLIVLLRVHGEDRTGAFQPADLLPALDALILRGWLGSTFLGMKIAGFFAHSVPWLLSLVGAGGFLGLLFLLWKHRAKAPARSSLILLAIALLMIGLSLTRSLYLSELAENPLPRHDRYLTAPTLLLFTVLVALAVRLWRKRPRLLLGLGLGFTLIQLAGVPDQSHWARPTGHYTFHQFIPQIRAWEKGLPESSGGQSLYLPHDIPYDGPVLEARGGKVRLPDQGLASALGATPVETPHHYQSWLGAFRQDPGSPWVLHQEWGRLEFLGIWGGRVWFRDERDRLTFTSQLLYPRLWVIAEDRFQLKHPQ